MGWREIVKENKLDVSVLGISDLLSGLRLDAEVYSLKYLETDHLLSKKETVSIGSITKVFSKGIFDINAECYIKSGGVPFVRIANLKNCLISKQDLVRIPDGENEKNRKTALHFGDLILSKTAYATASFVDVPICNASQDTIVVKLVDNCSISSQFLTVFLNSKYGNLQMQRWFTGNIQTHLNLIEAREIKVPVVSKELNDIVDKNFESYRLLLEHSSLLYHEAEELLLLEINLNEYVPSKANTSIRELTECLADNRFDAEYWEPRFDAILDRIKEYKGGCSTIEKEFSQIKNNFKPDQDTLYRYIEIGDVDVTTGEVSSTELEGKELPANAKITLDEKQLITSKVRPNRGATAILDDHKGCIASGAFVVLKESGRLSLETLQVYLKSPLIRDLLLRYNTGTAYPTIIDADILNLPIPLVDKSVQNAITEKVKQSNKERNEAKNLLEKAKRAVEIFIEKDEAEALRYLSS